MCIRDRCVAKMFKSQAATAKEYLNEAITQVTCGLWADHFNSLPVPSPVSFLPVTVMELVDRPDKDLINVEPLMEGRFFKHNDNAGRVKSDRHTPQAFSHFSWEASNHSLLVCDIQGVQSAEGDLFTDPQIHSIDGVENGNVSDGSGFGPGNFGYQGIKKFIETHKCNRLCKQLGLPSLSLDDDQLRAPSVWTTHHCCAPQPSQQGGGTCSRISASRIATTEIDKLRAGTVDYPDLQAPKQPSAADTAAAPPPVPAAPQPPVCSAQQMRQHTAQRQREAIRGLHSHAPHLLSEHDTTDPCWVQYEAPAFLHNPAAERSAMCQQYGRFEQDHSGVYSEEPQLRAVPQEVRRRGSYSELFSQACFNKPENRTPLHALNSVERPWTPEVVYDSPRTPRGGCRGYTRGEEFYTPSMPMSPAAMGRFEDMPPISPAMIKMGRRAHAHICLLYTSDAADEEDSVDLGGRRIIKTKNSTQELALTPIG
eukprot:TRINITY_DN20435_c0_g1_i2.p1 TRINITY_DN20435_c0_g1~~TRINITY_DN20435_c0_g1_i2.p1  ORF type:complete len:481 (+),score=111.22 TRINITY_DN20435_c0_g1_i2:71-1513(+)